MARKKKQQKPAEYILQLGNDRLVFKTEEVEADPALQKELAYLIKQKEENELQFFAPHGKAKWGDDCGSELVSMAEWIDDDTHTLYMNCSPNQSGKTAQATVKLILHLFPTNPKWPIFKYIEPIEFEGPQTLVAMGYDKGQLKDDLWPELQKWIPDEELGPYRAQHHGGTKSPAWDRKPEINLKHGSRIIFVSYEQPASVCAGIKCKYVLANEQIPEMHFNELDERGRTLGGICWVMPFTPHKVEGRPDSGANSFLFDLWRGQSDYGHDILRTRVGLDEVPDHIYSKEEKKRARIKWIDTPAKLHNEAMKREGEARYYGYFQRPTGLFYPEITPEIHFIPWTWEDIKDKGWTLYRSIDYGFTNPTSCGLYAVSPEGDCFRFAEYYRTGRDASTAAQEIIEELCGNGRQLKGAVTDKQTGATYNEYVEVQNKMRFEKTVLDWHCFHSSDNPNNNPTSFFFKMAGLKVMPAPKFQQDSRAQALRKLLKIDPDRRHLVTGKKGAPRFYVSSVACRKWIWEWERCVVDTRRTNPEGRNTPEVKRNKNDHAIDDSEYFASLKPRYRGGSSDIKFQPMKPISEHGGY